MYECLAQITLLTASLSAKGRTNKNINPLSFPIDDFICTFPKKETSSTLLLLIRERSSVTATENLRKSLFDEIGRNKNWKEGRGEKESDGAEGRSVGVLERIGGAIISG